MTTTTFRALLFALFALAAIGCGGQLRASRRGAQPIAVVRRGDMSGELALSSSLSAHYAAEEAMLAHCGGRVRFVTAEESHALAAVDPGDPTKADDPTSIDPRAERIHYVCVTREERLRRSH